MDYYGQFGWRKDKKRPTTKAGEVKQALLKAKEFKAQAQKNLIKDKATKKVINLYNAIKRQS